MEWEREAMPGPQPKGSSLYWRWVRLGLFNFKLGRVINPYRGPHFGAIIDYNNELLCFFFSMPEANPEAQ